MGYANAMGYVSIFMAIFFTIFFFKKLSAARAELGMAG
jgi:multiple sugar transport system permease protein